MSVNLKDYQEILEDLEPESVTLLENAWHEASKVLSPRGLDNYIKGVSALHNLRRGRSLVDCWIDEIPQVVKEIGEDIVSELATAVL
ncbi:MAG TPA: VWA domain-containing protein, partial [Nitrosomonas sp.]|nr:VWA domain-containing protein [Nitrosomonas sp.]